MPVKDQAAYMREYRARKKAEAAGRATTARLINGRPGSELADELTTLREEVARLKRELAARPPARDPFREFRPAPKPHR